jgi:hypothetical protein
MIDIYPSQLPGAPIERHTPAAGTLHDWLAAHCPSYRAGPVQPITATVRGVRVPADQWGAVDVVGQLVELRPTPADAGVVLWSYIGIRVGGAALRRWLTPDMPGTASGSRGTQLSGADLSANRPRLGGVVPEIAGRRRVFPDYLCQPRRYFVSPTQQAVDAMMCVGVGEYLIDPAEIRIGETDIAAIGSAVTYSIYGPGADVSAHPAHRNWYSAPEVGASTGSSGLRLTGGTAGTPSASATGWRIDGDSITVLPGAGIVPQDWGVGNIITATLRTRTVTVVDGGGPWSSPARDLVRGSFGDLGLVSGDQLLIDGLGSDDGRYLVHSISTTSGAGSASTIVGGVVASLLYASAPTAFTVGGYTVTLSTDYASAAALVSAINGQIGGAVATQVGGVITITESAPYGGQPIALSGYYAPTLGAAPTLTTGTATTSYTELTLDRWVTSTSDGVTTSGWQAAGSIAPGTYPAVEVQQPRVRTVGSVTTYSPTEYRITSLITGTIPGGTGVIGWHLQRLDPGGTDDAAWTGFAADISITGAQASIAIESSQTVGGWLGPFRVTPGAEQSGTIEVDVFAPSGIGSVNSESGAVEQRTRQVELQWRADGGAWTSVVYTITAATRDQIGYTYSLSIPATSARVDVRMRRIGAEDTAVNALDRLEWYGLRALLPAPTSYPGVTTMAVTLQGSDTIASATETQINLVATRRLAGAATRSIAAWLRYVCGSVGYAADDIDDDELGELDALWSARGDWYDHVHADSATVRDVLALALRAGHAELTIDAGRIRAVRDQPRESYEHMYTPQNMTAPLRRSVTLYDPDDYDGVDVEYVSAETWETETIQCRLPGDLGTRVDKLQLDGVTDRTRAWRIGMRQRRIHAYRRASYSWSTEWDALNSSYGSYCAVSADVPGYGQSARLVAYSAGVLQSSEPLAWTAGASHVVALRRPDGTLSGPHAATRIDDYRLQISAALDFTPVTAASAIEPTHMLFGTATRWSHPVLVTEITPSGDTVDVAAVGYDERIYADDDNAPD